MRHLWFVPACWLAATAGLSGEGLDYSGLGGLRAVRYFDALEGGSSQRRPPPLSEMFAGMRLETEQAPSGGSGASFTYDVEASLLAVSRFGRSESASAAGQGTQGSATAGREQGQSGEQLRPVLAPGAQLFAGVRSGQNFELFVGRRDTLRSVDRVALGGRAFRPGLHAVFDSGFLRFMGSPYFRETGMFSESTELGAPVDGRGQPSATGDRPPGQSAALAFGGETLALGLFYDVHRNAQGFAAEYAGVGLGFHVSGDAGAITGGVSVEQASSRGRARVTSDGNRTVGGSAARLRMDATWHGLVFAVRGFVAEPPLRRRGSLNTEGERSGYVSARLEPDGLLPIFSQALRGSPAPLLCSACPEGYLSSADASSFHTQAMTGAMGLGYTWSGGQLMFQTGTVVPLRVREHAGGGPFGELRPESRRLNEYAVLLRKRLAGNGELVAAFSRLDLREAGRSRKGAEMFWIVFRRPLEAR